MNTSDFIRNALEEDVGHADHTSNACIPADSTGKAALICKEKGIIAGVSLAQQIFAFIEPEIRFKPIIPDGSPVRPGDIVFTVKGFSSTLLKAERLVLNCMQRMSGIATFTRQFVDQISDLPAKILDTRKTTPGMRRFEKEAVRLGGGSNHRFGLFDMIMIKDNHIDYAGGIANAIRHTVRYLRENQLDLKIVIEARNLSEVKEIMHHPEVDRILLDNFSIPETKEAVRLIHHCAETESSGMIGLHNVRSYALCGVDYISIGALTHSVKSMDLSLKSLT